MSVGLPETGPALPKTGSCASLLLLFLPLFSLPQSTRGADDRQMLREARADLRQGKYPDAIRKLTRLAEADPDRWDLRDLLTRAHLDAGKSVAAEEVCDAYLQSHPDSEAARARKARIRFLRDDFRSAVEATESATGLEARVTRAEAFLAMGKKPEALAILEPLVEEYGKRSELAMKSDLFLFARGLALYADLKANSEMYKQVVRTVLPDCLVPDPNDAEIKTFLGLCYLEKHNRPDAQACFQEVLAVNRNYAPALAGLALLQLQGGHEDQAGQSAQRAVEADPALAEAAVARALAFEASGNRREAIAAVETGLKERPSSPRLRSLRAALAFLDGDEDRHRTEIEAVLAVNPKSPLPWYETGRLLAAGEERRFQEASTFLKKATEQDPEFRPALLEYGMNALRCGDEETADPILREANRLDPFHIRLQNTVNLLDDFRKEFDLIETDAYRVRLARRERAWMEPYVLRLLSRAHEDFGRRYGFQPEGKILVEVFYSHSDFSVRTAGVPGLGALGACFGRVVTTLSPRARRETGSPYNWGAVLWHEMAHVYALHLSKYRVPRWFTEGLSTYEESLGFGGWEREADLQILQGRAEGKLGGVGGLESKTSGGDATLSMYLQGSFILRYIVETHGFEAVVKLLQAYGAGKKTKEAFADVLAVGIEEFDKRFFAWLDAELAKVRYRFPPKEAASKLTAESDAEPGSAPKAAKAARKLLADKKTAAAITYARRALERDPDDADALSILGRGLLLRHEREEAVAALDRAVAAGAEDYDTFYALGGALLEEEETDRAIAALERAKACFPRLIEHPGPGANVYRLLNDAHLKKKETAAAVREMEAMVAVDHLDYSTRLKLARIRRDRGEWERVTAVLDEAAWIQTRDLELHNLAGEALARQERTREAIDRYRISLALVDAGATKEETTDRAEVHVRLAGLYRKTGERARAREHALEALKAVPGHPEAREIFDAVREER